ncbi:MAG: type III polyketide synthase [Myxococcaceae bacterium]
MATSHPIVRSVARRLPSHYADQATLIAALRKLWGSAHHNVDRLEDLHRSVQVSGRHLALPLPEYPALESFQARNDAWLRVATELGAATVRDALEGAGLTARDVDHLFFVTVTGVATPSVDARLMNLLKLRPDVRRSPLFGLGCVAGAAGMARASDVLRAYSQDVAVLLSVELCSLTLQREDLSIPNIIASGLFGDGAAAVVLAGKDRGGAGPRVLATRSVFYPDTERVMGWDVVDTGFKVVLSAKVPMLVKEKVRADVDDFLASQGLARKDIRHWVAHTGGPKVLEALQSALELPEGALKRSWASLNEAGNLSSASVLFVLADLLAAREASRDEYGLLLAMGPGFCSELVLLQW